MLAIDTNSIICFLDNFYRAKKGPGIESISVFPCPSKSLILIGTNPLYA